VAKSVFFSFYYDRDAWRVQQIINMGAVEGQPILNRKNGNRLGNGVTRPLGIGLSSR
jgi:hypothetical protein